MTTCDLCWAKFDTEEDLGLHVEMEEMVDWPIDRPDVEHAGTTFRIMNGEYDDA